MLVPSRWKQQQQDEDATLLTRCIAPVAQHFSRVTNCESCIGFEHTDSRIVVRRVPLLLQFKRKGGERPHVRTETIRNTNCVILRKGRVAGVVAHLPQPAMIDAAIHKIVLGPKLWARTNDLFAASVSILWKTA